MNAPVLRLPIRRLFRIVNGSTPLSGEPDFWGGDIAWVTPEDIGKLDEVTIGTTRRTLSALGYRNCGATLVPEGTLILTTRAPIGNLAIAGRSLCSNQGCKSLVPRHPLNTRFFYYALAASRDQLHSLGQGSTFREISSDQLASFEVPVPSRTQQDLIAAFLDRKTTAIDSLISKKERLIELLSEKRQALITQAVSRGLNSNARMKDTGIEWLGAMPDHWRLLKLKYMSPQITVGIVVTPSKYYVDEGPEAVPCPRSFNVKPSRIDHRDMAFISKESNQLLSKSILRKGDIVAVRTGQPGTAAVVDGSLDGANCVDLIIIRRSTTFDSRFLCHFLNSAPAHHQYGAGSEGALQQHFNVETAKDLLVSVPPLAEQVELVNRLDCLLGRHDRLVAAVERHLGLLREYRQGLISAAVTGKIDTNPIEAA